MKARVRVTLKHGVLDPQGKAIGNALASLGFAGIGEVRQGKLIEIDLSETDMARARAQLDAMCQELLANPVIEDYTIEIIPSGRARTFAGKISLSFLSNHRSPVGLGEKREFRATRKRLSRSRRHSPRSATSSTRAAAASPHGRGRCRSCRPA